MERYSKEVSNEPPKKKKRLSSIDTKINKWIIETFNNKEIYPYLDEIVKLFENSTLINKSSVTLIFFSLIIFF